MIYEKAYNMPGKTLADSRCKNSIFLWIKSTFSSTSYIFLTRTGKPVCFSFRLFPMMEKSAKDQANFLFCSFSLRWKRNQKIKPTVSAAAPSRSPQPSALPPHASSGHVFSNNLSSLLLSKNESLCKVTLRKMEAIYVIGNQVP
jgi:hypothetical protein